MEPDGHDEMPEPTGISFNITTDRVLQKLQAQVAAMVQKLTWDLATRDAVIEVLEEKLHESEQLREEAEGANEQYSNEASVRDILLSDAEQALDDSRLQVSRLVKAEAEALERIEELTNQLSEKGRPSSAAPAQRDAFLEAPLTPTVSGEILETDQTERLPAVPSSPKTPPA